MSRIVYVNGRYRPYADASVHFEDRGYQFSDGVYEVVLVRRGRLVDADNRHQTRFALRFHRRQLFASRIRHE